MLLKRVIYSTELKAGRTNHIFTALLLPHVINFQAHEGKHLVEAYDYQAGETWAGNIAEAGILFLSETLSASPPLIKLPMHKLLESC